MPPRTSVISKKKKKVKQAETEHKTANHKSNAIYSKSISNSKKEKPKETR